MHKYLFIVALFLIPMLDCKCPPDQKPDASAPPDGLFVGAIVGAGSAPTESLVAQPKTFIPAADSCTVAVTGFCGCLPDSYWFAGADGTVYTAVCCEETGSMYTAFACNSCTVGPTGVTCQ